MMPPLIYLLLSAFLLLGITPAWGMGALPEQSSELAVKEYEIAESSEKSETLDLETFSTKPLINPESLEPILDVPTERVYLEPSPNVPPVSEVEQKPQEKIAAGNSKPILESVDQSVLSAFGIKRLAKGINIFRFSSYYLKARSPLSNRRMLPQ